MEWCAFSTLATLTVALETLDQIGSEWISLDQIGLAWIRLETLDQIGDCRLHASSFDPLLVQSQRQLPNTLKDTTNMSVTRPKISETKYGGFFIIAHHVPAFPGVLFNCCLCWPFCHLFVVLVHFVINITILNSLFGLFVFLSFCQH